MNSIVCHPFYQIAQGAALMFPPAAAASPGVVGALDHWQTLIGALAGGLLGVVGALVVARMIGRRDRRIAAAMVLPDLQQLTASYEALALRLTNESGKLQSMVALTALLVKRPNLFALHTPAIGQLTDLDARLYSHLFQCEMVHTAFETGIRAYAASQDAISAQGVSMPPRRIPQSKPHQVFLDWQLCVEHATLATYYLDRLVFGRWPRALALLRMRIRPNDVDRRSAHLLKTGDIQSGENAS